MSSLYIGFVRETLLATRRMRDCVISFTTNIELPILATNVELLLATRRV